MAATQLVLKWMGSIGGHSSPGSKTVHRLPVPQPVEEATIQVGFWHSGELFARSNVDDELGDYEGSTTLATLKSSGRGLLLEPRCSYVYIEPPGSATRYGSDRIAVPESKTTERHYITLREDDIVNFEHLSVKFRVIFERIEVPDIDAASDAATSDVAALETMPTASTPHLVPIQDEIQVKSSNAEEVNDGEVTESENEDLDEVSIETPDEDVRPLNVTTTVPAVKETPNAKAKIVATADTDEDGEPFSTAQDLAADGGASESDDSPDNSPSVRTRHGHEPGALEGDLDSGDDNGSSNTRLRNALNGELGSFRPSLDDIVGEKAVVAATADDGLLEGRTKSGGDSSSFDETLRNLPVGDGVATIAGLDCTAGETGVIADEIEDYELTSEPFGPRDVALETAKRTGNADWSRKRKVGADHEAQEGEDEDGVIVAIPKKRKTNTATAASDITSDTDQPTSSATSGKLARPTRRSPITRSPADNTATEPQSARRRVSPKVVIPRASETPSSTATSPAFAGRAPKVLLSHDSGFRKTHSKWLKEQGSEVIDDVKTRRTHFVCVVNSNHLRTAKVLRSLALGKCIVTEAWLSDSKKSGQLLDPEDYWHPEVGNVTVDRRQLFHGKNLFFTSTLADKVYGSGWQSLVELCNEAGASVVKRGHSGDYGDFSQTIETICFGANNSDPDVARLQSQFSCTVHTKALVSHAIITGEFDLEDEEFVLPQGGSKKRK